MGQYSHITGSLALSKVLVHLRILQQSLSLSSDFVDSYSSIDTYGSSASGTYTGSYRNIFQGLLAVGRYYQALAVFRRRTHGALVVRITSLGIFLGGYLVISIAAHGLDVGTRYQCLGIPLDGVDSYSRTYTYSCCRASCYIQCTAIILQGIDIIGQYRHIIGSINSALADFSLYIIVQLVDSHIALNWYSRRGTNCYIGTYAYIEDFPVAICLDR